MNQSTWDPVPVQRRICERMLPLVAPTAWVIDDVSVPKDGQMPVAVAPRYCGAQGKRANCQVAVSVHAASDTASCPPRWRLFLPEDRASDRDRRARTRIPPEVTHQEKWRLALDMLDTLAEWGMKAPAVVAYGTNAHLRAASQERRLAYVLAIRAGVTAYPFATKPEAPARRGTVGCWHQPRYRHRAPSMAALGVGLERTDFTPLTWRQGSRGELRSRFAAVRARPAGKAVERPITATASAEQGWWDGVLPDCRLLTEWPEDAEASTEYWLSNLPADTPIADLAGLAPPHHPRDRRLRLPHRTAPGPKSARPGLTPCQVLDALQSPLRCRTGICTTCHQPLPLPARTRTTPRSRQT